MTLEEARAEVNRLLQLGQIDQDTAETMMARFAVTGDINYQPSNQPINSAELALQPAPTMFTDGAKSASAQTLVDVVNNPLNNPQSVEEAQNEIDERARIQELSFIQAMTDPAALARMGKTALKGPSQTVNALVNGVPGLVGTLIGADEFAGKQFDDLATKNQQLNDLFNVSDPIRAEESLAEVITSAAVPGGIGVKAAAVATDFTVDQTVRELTDEKGSSYETVFDRAGVLSDEAENFSVPPLVAIPIAVAGGIVTAQGIKALRGAQIVKAPKLADIIDADRFAPPDLQTLETAGDAAKAYALSETAALTTIVERAGVPNIDDIEKTLTLNGHASANVRAREAVRGGYADINGKTYQVPVSVNTLYEAAMSLPFDMRKKLERFFNAKDQLDDVRIAIAKNIPGNHVATEARLLREIAIAATGIPNIRQFEKAFENATEAARDLIEGTLLSPQAKLYLATNRKNYVPRNASSVDVQAPFFTRLGQTQREGEIDPDDWFLKDRNSHGTLDLDSMGNPFERLMSYTEAVLKSKMVNDAKVAVVDAIMNSKYGSVQPNGKTTIRLVDEADDLAGNQDRLVRIYRNGEKETYITSALQAQLLRFDPYVAKHPTMFAVKRLAEWGMVGAGTITFAPVTMLRDTLGALILREPGTVAGNIVDVAKAVPKQLWAKAQNAIATNINAGLISKRQFIPEAVWDNQSRKAFADTLSKNYLNSLYHLSNQSGGFDGSVMRNNVEYARNAFGEIKRTLADSSTLHHPALDNMVTRFGKAGATAAIDGFLAIFDSVQNAPRFAALEKTVKSGKAIPDASILARRVTGDVAESGRVFRPDGKLMFGDIAKQNVTSFVTPPLGKAVNALRETAPFVNPTIQGSRNFIKSFTTDPAGTMGRAWLYAGLPALTAYSWNEMMGEEYNDYAMDRRSSQDVAMSMYIAVPGLPPEQGIEIPVMHELLLFTSPYTRMLHGLVRGENQEEMSNAMQTLGGSIMSNTIEASSPIPLDIAFNLAGKKAPDGIFDYLGGSARGNIVEDNVGFLPQNLEELTRTLFSANGDMAVQLMYAMSGESDLSFNDFLGSVYTSVAKRAPVLKNVAGLKTANVSFSIPAEYDRKIETAMTDFWTYYSVHTAAKNEDGFTKPATSTSKFVDDKGAMGDREDLPFLMIGPDTLPEPLNPLYPVIGEIVYDLVRKNGIGVSGLDDRMDKYNKYVRQLKAYNIGNREAIAEWESKLENLEDAKDPESVELQNWLGQFKLDLTLYEDRVKLINIIENEKSYILRQKVELIQNAEQIATERLIAEGMLQPGQSFNILKHMNPMDIDPLSK